MRYDELFPDDTSKVIARKYYEADLKAYINYIHYQTTNTEFTFKPFHDLIIEKLEAIANQIITKNLLLNLPVGFGKSLIVEYFISWCYARNINNTFLYTSYADKLITKLSKEVKDIIESDPYEWLWNYKLKKDEKSKVNWSIEGGMKRSGLCAGSMGGTMTGLDAGNPAVQGFSGALIIDDPQKVDDSIYETKRRAVIDTYTGTLKTRLRRSDVPIILIMQRLHEEDLTGYILEHEKDDWEHVEVKALVNEQSIWEEKVSTQTLIKEREQSPWVFYAQRQQEPSTDINSSFKGLCFAPDDEITNIHNGYGHVDKGFEGADGTAFTIAKQKGNTLYVLGKLWEGRHIDDCKAEIFQLKQKYLCGSIFTETNDDKGYFAKNNVGVIPYHEKQNKHFKIMTYLYPAWKSIKFLPETDPNYIKQIQHYNEMAKHDDSPDSLSSLIRAMSNVTKVIGKRPF